MKISNVPSVTCLLRSWGWKKAFPHVEQVWFLSASWTCLIWALRFDLSRCVLLHSRHLYFVFPPSRKMKFKIQIKDHLFFYFDLHLHSLNGFWKVSLNQSVFIMWFWCMLKICHAFACKKEGKWRDGVDISKRFQKSYANEGFKKWVSREHKNRTPSHVIKTNEFFPNQSN